MGIVPGLHWGISFPGAATNEKMLGEYDAQERCNPIANETCIVLSVMRGKREDVRSDILRICVKVA